MKRMIRPALMMGVMLLGVGLVAMSLRTAAAAAQPREIVAHMVTLTPAQDNTLYETDLGNISNGQGAYLFAGRTKDGKIRRAALAFDLSGIPPWATVVSATLTLNMSKSIAGETPVTLHTLQRGWGEGTSAAVGEEGAGAAAEPGDATWLYAFYDTESWTTPGGDFEAAAVATTPVGGTGAYVWASADLTADVQAWVSDRASNFGWLLLGDETTTETAKRFDSAQGDPANGPVLTLTYEAEVFALYAPVVVGGMEIRN